MRILPVLDLMHGQVVRGVAGRRQEYRPLCSALAESSDPLVLARALRDYFHFTDFYLADLDAIAGSLSAVEIYDALQREGFRLLVDAGLRTANDAKSLLAAGVFGIVAGLETLSGPNALAELVEQIAPSRLVFSLDMKNGQPLATSTAWRGADAWSIVDQAIELGIRSVLVLDLVRVGVGTGTGTEEFCARIKKNHPQVAVLAGGGVRGPEDLDRLRQYGVDGVLVASALHDGRLRPKDLP